VLKQRIAGGALALAGGGFLIAEAVSAAAWKTPEYSYLKNFISDLEVAGPVTVAGNLLHSPLWLVMSAAFVVNGLLVTAALLILGAPYLRRLLPLLIVVTGISYGLGLAWDGFFHEDTALPQHILGAIGIGIGGNLSLILLGVFGLRGRLPRGLAVVELVLGAVGLTFYLLLSYVPHDIAGLVERIAAYPLFLSQLGLGVALLSVSSTTLERWVPSSTKEPFELAVVVGAP
jgi:hypothetical membrane protein